MPTTVVGESEWEDFDAALKRYDRIRAEFELSERAEPMVGSGIQPIRGTLTIRNRETGAEKVYSTGHGSAWPSEFERDLAAGLL